jgi:PAS domain S-box-containing protein
MLRRVVFLFLVCELAFAAQAAARHETAPVSRYEGRKLAISPSNPSSLWQERRGLILGVLAVVAMQSALIAGLLVNRATRRKAVRALAETEERMALATESANLGLWVWDIARDDFWVTPRFRSMFGFRPEERISFAVFLDRVHPQDREAMEREVRKAVDEKQPYESQYRLLLSNDETPWISATGRVEYTVSGAASRMHGVCRDITERRQAQLETRRLQHEIAHVTRVSMMGQLASALAHEINQPLGAILRNAEAAELFMQSTTPDLEEIRAILADIRSDDQRAGNVIDRMRTLLKRHILETQLLDLTELVDNVAELARPEALTRRVKLAVTLPPDLPSVRGDRVHLQQVLLNLILNGMDALNGGAAGRHVTVSGRMNAARTVEIAVSDTGSGIAAEKLPHVFEPFFTTKPDGMGMGLPISRTIVESHGGKLWVENNNGAGATFRFTLPQAEEAKTS